MSAYNFDKLNELRKKCVSTWAEITSAISQNTAIVLVTADTDRKIVEATLLMCQDMLRDAGYDSVVIVSSFNIDEMNLQNISNIYIDENEILNLINYYEFIRFSTRIYICSVKYPIHSNKEEVLSNVTEKEFIRYGILLQE